MSNNNNLIVSNDKAFNINNNNFLLIKDKVFSPNNDKLYNLNNITHIDCALRGSVTKCTFRHNLDDVEAYASDMSVLSMNEYLDRYKK